MNIELHIEELLLTGFPRAQRHRIAEALQSELSRLMSDADMGKTFMKDSHHPQLPGGSFAVQAGQRPEAIGRQIAGAVYQSVSAGEEGN